MISPEQQNIIRKTTSKYKPVLVAVFGSYARNEQTPLSDLDLLVEFDSKVNLIELIGLEQELTELLGVNVDLVTRRSVNDELRNRIESEIIRIL